MLSIFDHKEPEAQQPDRKLAINRLEQVLGAPQRSGAPEERQVAVAVAEEPPVRLAPPMPLAWERKASPPLPEPAASTPAMRSEAASSDLQKFSEQFTRTFLGALTEAVKEIHALVGEDRKQMESALESFAQITRELDSQRSEMAAVSQKVDLLVQGLQEQALRLGKAEERLGISAGATGTLQDAQQQLEKRLELQAGVIRTLHSSLQAREERVDRMLATFQALHAVANDRASATALPDRL